MITALIDGDWILYAAGFAGQKTELVCPSISGRVFPTMTELKKEASWTEESPIFKRDVLDAEENFYYVAKQMVDNNCQSIADKSGKEVTPVVLIAGDGNFRNRLATIKPYKGTREAHAKPLMYNRLRDYLLGEYDTQVIHDQEVDDELAIIQSAAIRAGRASIIVSVDKDMLQVPGWHRNPNKGFQRVSEDSGLLTLYRQAAMGDTTDNIGGAYKVGPVAAKTLFPAGMDELALWNALVACYQTSIDKHGDKYGGLDAYDAALENMRLVYLRRKANELWYPPSSSAREVL